MLSRTLCVRTVYFYFYDMNMNVDKYSRGIGINLLNPTICISIYTSQQKKRYKHFLKYIFMLKPKQLFIIIYVNVCEKRVYPHKTNNNILYRYGKIPESQLSVP
jgi:hypothetical protein